MPSFPRSTVRLAAVGLALGLVAACGDDPVEPADFTDPTAVTANLGAIDSAFDSDAFRSFTVASLVLDPAASAAALQPAAQLLGGTLPKLSGRVAGPMLLTGVRAQRLQALAPEMSVAAAAGRIIPDSMYGRVFQWDEALDEYTWQDSVVAGLNGVRFILYEVVDDVVVEPVVEVGTLDLIDESTPSTLQIHVLVKGVGGTPTYVDYTAAVTATATSVRATVDGFISNGLTAGANKTLTFDETFTVTDTGASIAATFTLNNPPITITLNESVTFTGESLVINVTFRIVQPGETVSFSGRITSNLSTLESTIHAVVRVNGHPVATIDGNTVDAQWVDAGGEPLTVEDLVALDGLNAAAAQFFLVVTSLFAPIGMFFVA